MSIGKKKKDNSGLPRVDVCETSASYIGDKILEQEKPLRVIWPSLYPVSLDRKSVV